MRHRLAELAKLSLIQACHGLYLHLSWQLNTTQMLSHPITPHIPHPIPPAGLCFSPGALITTRCTWHVSKWKQTGLYSAAKGIEKNALTIPVVAPLGCLWFQLLLKSQHAQYSSTWRWHDFNHITRVYCQTPLSLGLNCWYGAIRG